MANTAYATKRVSDLIARMDGATISNDSEFIAFSDAADEVRAHAQEAGVDPALIDQLNESVRRLSSQLSFCTLS